MIFDAGEMLRAAEYCYERNDWTSLLTLKAHVTVCCDEIAKLQAQRDDLLAAFIPVLVAYDRALAGGSKSVVTIPGTGIDAMRAAIANATVETAPIPSPSSDLA